MSFIKKLDDPAEFAAIPTGKTTKSSLRKHEQDRYNVWYNHFRRLGHTAPADREDITWVADNALQLNHYIRETYSEAKGYSPNTTRNYLEGLANVLLAIDKARFKEFARPLYAFSKSIHRETDAVAGESKLNDDDLANFVSYEDLVTKRDLTYATWKENLTDLPLNMTHLILALNTYVPPLRHDCLDMVVYRNPIEAPPPEGKANYIWEYAPGQWAFVIGSDKIENQRQKQGLERQVMKLADEIPGITNGQLLNAIITESMAAHPRAYALVGTRLKIPMPPLTYNGLLASAFAPKRPHQNLIRKAYINHWHRARIDGHELSANHLNAIASRMRHTLAAAVNSYRKINVEDTTPTPAAAVAPEPPRPRSPPKYNPAAYSRKYRAEHLEQMKEKRKASYNANKVALLSTKVLWHLNSGMTTKPTKASIAKYGLVKDPVTGLWSSATSANLALIPQPHQP